MMRTILGFCAAVVAMAAAATAQADVRFGVMANRGELAATAEWTEFTKYLADKIGEPVVLVTFNIDRTFEMVGGKMVDFVLTNPVQTAGLVEKFGVRPVALWSKNGESAFAGVIIASPKSGVTHAADIKGKKVIAYNPESAGAYTFQRYHLLQAGVDVTKDVASMQFTKKQDDVVLAVKAGVMDVGFVRTGVLESMVAAGRIAMSDVVVVDKVNDPNDKLVRTTPLYPDWFVSAVAGSADAMIAKVKAATLALPADAPAAKAAKVDGFVEPLALDQFVTMSKALKLPPFDR